MRETKGAEKEKEYAREKGSNYLAKNLILMIAGISALLFTTGSLRAILIVILIVAFITSRIRQNSAQS